MSAETELREFFREHGLAPDSVRYNESLDVYGIDVGVEGTDDRFLNDETALGTDGPVTDAIDARQISLQGRRLDGESIPSGTVNVVDTMRDAHFRIKIE